MSRTRDNYQIVGNSLDEIKLDLNFKLQRLADRIDKIEGIRGTASIESTLDMNANTITDVGAGSSSGDAARVGDLTGINPTFDSLTLSVALYLYDANGTLIHSIQRE